MSNTITSTRTGLERLHLVQSPWRDTSAQLLEAHDTLRGAGFEVIHPSEAPSAGTYKWDAFQRRRIQETDGLVVLQGWTRDPDDLAQVAYALGIDKAVLQYRTPFEALRHGLPVLERIYPEIEVRTTGTHTPVLTPGEL